MHPSTLQLLGLAIGGGIALFLSLLDRLLNVLDDRRARSEERLQATLLLLHELESVQLMLSRATGHRMWWPRGTRLPDQWWRSHGPVLALGDRSLWVLVSRAHATVDLLNDHVGRLHRHGGSPWLEPSTAADLQVHRVSIAAAVDGLRRACPDRRRAGRLRRTARERPVARPEGRATMSATEAGL